MRISCNGCRVLRKGCNKDCTIRPCLQWIKSPDSQANATLFLAKFYGRAGLLNLIESGPDHLRPAIFRSLLYEACGRIVNPVDGSVGLMWSGNWAHCQAAVDAVLSGSPIQQQNPPSGAPASYQIVTPHKTYDIRHVSKDPTPGSIKPAETERIDKTKTQTGRFKRLARSKNQTGESSRYTFVNSDAMHGHNTFPVETTVKGSTAVRFDPCLDFRFTDKTDAGEVGLELTLGTFEG